MIRELVNVKGEGSKFANIVELKCAYDIGYVDLYVKVIVCIDEIDVILPEFE
jgi:DNA-directed RNA polymerase subunit beta'